jgi:phenylpropionate dioxygenase-like ring-hydroxylating dioxygenase large terminal subunit
MTTLLDDNAVIERVFEHIDHNTTDEGAQSWREPVENYRSEERFRAELDLLKRVPVPFCPSVALTGSGDYVARMAAGTPLLVVRGEDGEVRAFRNACRHRGMRLADGAGSARAFVCGYHGWAYRLDGRLQYVPHGHGFPGVDKSCHGLVPVTAVEEKHGFVWVTQDPPVSRGALDGMVDVLGSDQRIFASGENTDDVNWKLSMEANMEGYHIKFTHPESFYPYGYDNLNVVEVFGPNSRVTFPFRRIEKLRNLAPTNRRIDGMVTFTYNIFPNVLVAMLSNHTTVSISEPESPGRTRFISYRLHSREGDDSAEALERAKRDAAFVADQGAQEDRAMVRAIQAGLDSGANEHFTYGRFEQAIVHFHQQLTAHLERL